MEKFKVEKIFRSWCLIEWDFPDFTLKWNFKTGEWSYRKRWNPPIKHYYVNFRIPGGIEESIFGGFICVKTQEEVTEFVDYFKDGGLSVHVQPIVEDRWKKYGS
jgi:hypothetical protein